MKLIERFAIVPADKRLNFLSEKIKVGFDSVFFEQLVYSFATKYSEDYKGGYWEFVEYENGAWMMLPPSIKNGKYNVSVPTNFYDGKMTNVEFGVGINMFALHYLMEILSDKGKDFQHLLENYYLLRDVANTEVFKFID